MKQLNRIQSLIFLVGGILMTIGAGCYAFLLCQDIMSVLFLVGAIAFASMQMAQSYEGSDIAVRRLRRIMLIADVLFVVSAFLAFEESHHVVGSLLSGHGSLYIDFVTATHGRWVVLLLIAAILELYTTHRISAELDKAN